MFSKGVESERCPSWHTAMANGRPIACDKSREGARDSIADGLSVIEVRIKIFTICNSKRLLLCKR